jgi:hypothetical protein
MNDLMLFLQRFYLEKFVGKGSKIRQIENADIYAAYLANNLETIVPNLSSRKPVKREL